jgi:hypothetical protein
MMTAKKIMKAQFLAARAQVAAMDDESVVWEDQSMPYEQSPCIFVRREIARRARRIYAAMPEVEANGFPVEVEELDIEKLFDEIVLDDVLLKALQA